MNRIVRTLVFIGVVVALVLSPNLGLAQGPQPRKIDDLEALWTKMADFDARTTVVQPTRQQLEMVTSLGATARWNRFGTPRSLIKYGGVLASGVQGEPAVAAREWIRANRALFRLSDRAVTNLELVHDIQLPESTAHAVLFNQRFGNLTAVQDGLIAVAVANGEIIYVSSSAVGDASAPGAPTLTPLQAWLAAATEIGRGVAPAQLTNLRTEHSWTVFDVAGFTHPQRARLRAFPIPGAGVRAVYETNVVDVQGGDATAYTSFVDAQAGAILFRKNRVMHAADHDLQSASHARSGAERPAMQTQTHTFDGEHGDGPGECGELEGPFNVPDDADRIEVVASAALASNDIVIKLFYRGASQNGTPQLIAEDDSGTSPEQIIVTDPQPGWYSPQICVAQNAIITLPPYTYVGQFVADSTERQFYQPYWKFFPANPPLAANATDHLNGNYPDTDTRVVGCWPIAESTRVADSPRCQMSVRNGAARAPWDHEIMANASSNTTKGNQANTSEAWGSPLTPSEQYRPQSPVRQYVYPWTDQWNNMRCDPAAFGTPERNDIDAAVTNLFVQHNRMHDWAYRLGFTEQAYNAQQNNFGRTTPERENDPETGNAQAGAISGGAPSYTGRDNANQITLQDGIPPITNMYLWQPIAAAFYSACVDGDYDMSIIGHEYTHLISNRMVGGPDSDLTGFQGLAMGESWSDLAAVEYLNEYSFVPVKDENRYAVGAYVTKDKQTGIRNYSMNNNPLTYGNFGYDMVCDLDLLDVCTGPSEEHSDAEIWDAANFDIRQLLVAKYNKVGYLASDAELQQACANGRYPFEYCPGNRRWIRIVFAAFLLMQPGVDMLDARDAYLAADLALYKGVPARVKESLANQGKPLTDNQRELWAGFARRGMGHHASSRDADDVDPAPNFESPLTSNEATITFRPVASDEGNVAIATASIFPGPYEARSTPIADTRSNTARTATAKFLPGTYEFVAQAPGYGHYRFTATFKAGQVTTLTVPMATNWASKTKGATITGNGSTPTPGEVVPTADADRGLRNLIDDTEATTVARTNRTQGPNGTAWIVDLGGAVHTVGRVQVSALQRHLNAEDPNDPGGQSRFSALRRFEILACNSQQTNCASAANFTRIYLSSASAFPGSVPRPTAPDLNIRSFNVTDTAATHIMLRVLTNQCTGQSLYHGEQDQDPSNPTDCRYDPETGAPTLSEQAQNVRAAELQVFEP